ncbi:hypothetical protein D3C76_1391630 [compost metagenome]
MYLYITPHATNITTPIPNITRLPFRSDKRKLKPNGISKLINPIIIATRTEALCLITETSLVHSSLGSFKFTITPTIAVKQAYRTGIISNNKLSIQPVPREIIRSTLLTITIGTVMVRFTAILLNNIVFVGTGALFKIQIWLPSSEIELEVVQLNATKRETNSGANLLR